MPHASNRLASPIVRARWHTCDLRTFSEWGKATATSTWQLRAWCNTAGVSGRDVLSFVRGLRVVTQARLCACGYEEILDIAEQRALMRFLRRAGLPAGRNGDRPTIDQFIARQTFIGKAELIQRVRELLAEEERRPKN